MADFVSSARFMGKRKIRASRSLIIALGIVFAALIGGCVFQFILAPNMRIENIVIDNDTPLGSDEIISTAGLRGLMRWA